MKLYTTLRRFLKIKNKDRNLNLIIIGLFLSSLIVSSLNAEIQDEHISNFSSALSAKKYEKKNEMSKTPLLKGILLISDKKDLNSSDYKDVQGIETYNLDIPGSKTKL